MTICWKAIVYIDHFGNVVTNISKRQFIEFAKEDPTRIIMKTKTSKPFYQITRNCQLR
jgi:S-adenosylmethionine hydrolase